MKYRRIILSVLLILSLMFSSLTIYAQNSTMTETEDLDISKTLESRDEKHQYNIVFNLPTQAIEEPTVVDIVFVMDTTSIANYTNVRNEINNFLDHMLTNGNVVLNVGVVKFALNINQATTSLTPLNSSSIASIKSKFTANYASGSNMYGGIMTGRKLLETGTALPENKYLVVASDFGGYKSDVGDGKGLSFFYNYRYGTNGVEALHNNGDFDGRYNYTQSANSETSVFTVDAVDKLVHQKIFFTGTPVSAETDKYLTQTGPDAGEFPDGWRVLHTWTIEEKSKVIVDWTFTQRKDFPTAFEKNIYKSAHEMLDIKNTGINILAVTSPYQAEDGSAYKRKFNAASNAFKDWFEINIGTRYEITENESFTNLLDDLESKYTYLLGKGEIVDVIADKFTLVPGKQDVVLNGIVLPQTELGNGDVAFGTEVNGVYPYVYHYENVDGEETVTWNINKEARKDDLLQFKFAIRLKEIPSDAGEYLFDTNESAHIDYISSKEVDDGVTTYTKTQDMPSPKAPVNVGEVIATYVDADGNTLSPSFPTTGEVGESYTTEQKAIDGYTLFEIRGNETGIYTLDPITVTYVYRLNEVPVVVTNVTADYVDEQGNELSESVISQGAVGTAYSTQAKDIPNYTLLEVRGNETGNYTLDPITVTYVYKKNEVPVVMSSVTAVYIDEQGNELSGPIVTQGAVGTAYSTQAKDIPNYTLLEVRGNETGNYTLDPITVTYVYKKNEAPIQTGKVMVHYVDVNGKELVISDSMIGDIGSSYRTLPKEIEGYHLVQIRGDQDGTFSSSEITIVYVYELNDPMVKKGTVIINYLDTQSNSLSVSDLLSGTVGNSYETQSKEIPGYKLLRIVGNELGKFTESIVEINYIYEKVIVINPDNPDNIEGPTLPNAGISESNIMLIAATAIIVGSGIIYFAKTKKKHN